MYFILRSRPTFSCNSDKAMRKNLFVALVLSLLMTSATYAQLNGDGYYRVKNSLSKRYISIIHDKSNSETMSGKADLGALRSFLSWDKVSSDPSTIIYFEKTGDGVDGGKPSEYYNFCGQGTSTMKIINHNIGLVNMGSGKYRCFAREGSYFYLGDVNSDAAPEEVGYLTSSGNSTNSNWNILPVSSTGDYYFGVKPTVEANGKYYATMFADFGFTPASSAAGMKVFYVDRIWNGNVIIREIEGAVPAATPVVFICPSSSPSGNRLDIAQNTATLPTENKLSGVYFCINTGEENHKEWVTYDPNTMRMLGVCSDGRPGFVTKTESDFKKEYAFQPKASLMAIPANTAYLVVPAGSPAEMPLMTYEEYAAGIDGVTVDGNPTSDITTLSGVTVRKKVTSTDGLRPGVYIWNKKKIVVK